MRILLTNDDGVYAPGLVALREELDRLGEVHVVAPATEQSGVGHSITLLSPLIVQEVFDNGRRLGWAVEGSPADCVKLAILELLPGRTDVPLAERRPDLVVSGINSGANAGINVLYSGTVAAAIEGAFFGVTSVAVSLEAGQHPDYDRAAAIAGRILEQFLRHDHPRGLLVNMNIPSLEGSTPRGVRVVPMGLDRYADRFERRVDPRGRRYYWITGDPTHHSAATEETDITCLAEGYVTLTPLRFDMTHRDFLGRMAGWKWNLSGS